MNVFGITKRKAKPKVNERMLLKKVVESRLRKSTTSEVFKLNLELLVWHEFNRLKNSNKLKYSSNISYQTYCLAVFVRIVESYMLSSEKKAV